MPAAPHLLSSVARPGAGQRYRAVRLIGAVLGAQGHHVGPPRRRPSQLEGQDSAVAGDLCMQRSAKIQHQEDTKGTREVHKDHMRRLQQQALSPMGIATQSIPVRNGSLLCADAFSLRAGKHRAEKLLNMI